MHQLDTHWRAHDYSWTANDCKISHCSSCARSFDHAYDGVIVYVRQISEYVCPHRAASAKAIPCLVRKDYLHTWPGPRQATLSGIQCSTIEHKFRMRQHIRLGLTGIEAAPDEIQLICRENMTDHPKDFRVLRTRHGSKQGLVGQRRAGVQLSDADRTIRRRSVSQRCVHDVSPSRRD